MSDLAIHVENLSKRYRIGDQQEGYGTLRETIASTFESSLRMIAGRNQKRVRSEIWALKEVSFEVRQGEVLGIIGRNGAGKSTLLKILARVTYPTLGKAEINGRVGSLLEVGTGFHPELTGRENIFLNGAILGMHKSEIERKYDEIVDFADIGPFLDTPVKRYSSGMYMRLAFSIAAYLEPEILIVDEVLAVGDAAFQKKCLGKMNSVSKQGRTVLFVSHNMPAIQSLCDRVLLIRRGELVAEGPPGQIIQLYLENETASAATRLDLRQDRTGDGSARLVSMQIESTDPDKIIRSTSRLKLTIGYKSERPVSRPQFVVAIYDHMDNGIYLLHNDFVGGLPETLPPQGSVTCLTGPINLTPGRCVVSIELLKGNVKADYVGYAGYFDVVEEDVFGSGMVPPRDWVVGVLDHEWWLNQE